LAREARGNVPLVWGESFATNMGVMLKVGNDVVLRKKLDLDGDSQIVLSRLQGAIDLGSLWKLWDAF